MSGLLGSMIAGGVKGYADNKIKDINRAEEFNLQSALLTAREEMEMRLKERGFEMEDAREQAKKDKVAGIANSVKDPMEGKGGYESEEAAAERKRGLINQKADALADAGEYDAAKVYYGRADAQDKSALSLRQLEVKEQQILGTIKNAEERNRIYEELGNAKNETQLAKLEAAAAKVNSGGKPNDAQTKRADFIEAYANDPKYVKNGKLTGAGYDKLNKLSDDNDTQKVTEEPVLDLIGNVRIGKDGQPMMTRKVTRTEPVTKAAPAKAATKGTLVLDKNGNYVFSR